MTEDEIREFVGALDGVDLLVAGEGDGGPEVAWGDTFFFLGDRRIPFATIVTKDYPDLDVQSDLDRPGVFRLNVWVTRETFARLFGDEVVDYAALDTLMPHPVYGAQSWVSVLNPGLRTSELARALLTEAYDRAVARHKRRPD